MDIWPRSEASWKNVKFLGQYLSDTCEFTCALTQSIEPIICNSRVHNHYETFSRWGWYWYSWYFCFLSTHQAQEETENHITGTSQMQNFSQDDGQYSHSWINRSFWRISLTKQILCSGWYVALSLFELNLQRACVDCGSVCVCADLILRIFRNNCKWSKDKSRNVIALCQREQN